MDLGMPELIFIFFIALLIFGPAQLPKLGRQLGKTLGEFKRASNEFKHQLEDEVHRLEVQQLKDEARKAVGLDAPEGTVPKGPITDPVDFSKLSHDPGWEHRTIRPADTPSPAAPEPAAAPKPTGDQVG
jgi:TatA/E family protein of Tat protein translocase